MAQKKYQKNRDGSSYWDKNGFNRWSKDGGKTVYGSSYKLGVGTKKFGSSRKKK